MNKKMISMMIMLPVLFVASTVSAEVGGTVTRVIDRPVLISESSSDMISITEHNTLLDKLKAEISYVVRVLMENITWEHNGGAVVFENGNYSINAGCNNIFGSYEMNGSSIDFGPSASTMMMCAPDLMKKDQEIIKDLDAVTTIKIVDGHVVLSGDDVEIILTPKKS